MDVVVKTLLLQQIKYKLQLVGGEVKKSKVRAIMKLCVRHMSHFRSNQWIGKQCKQNHLPQGYQNDQRGTPNPTKLLLLHFLRPYLLLFLLLGGGPTPTIRTANYEPRRSPNLSFFLRFGERPIYILKI